MLIDCAAMEGKYLALWLQVVPSLHQLVSNFVVVCCSSISFRKCRKTDRQILTEASAPLKSLCYILSLCFLFFCRRLTASSDRLENTHIPTAVQTDV